MNFLYRDQGIYLQGFDHQLGTIRRSLEDLKAGQMIANSVEDLAKTGYRFQFGIGPEENVLTLAEGPFTRVLGGNAKPVAAVFHHSYADSTTIIPPEGTDVMSRANYLPQMLMRGLRMDHVPYLGSFASGCAGFLSLVITGADVVRSANEPGPVICLTADVRPQGATCDALREKILTSDCSSAFLMGKEQRGYQLLGLGFYSTTRALIPLVEIVKRTVQMARDIARELSIELTPENTIVHYPNIFPEAWDMVTHYLRVPGEHHIMDGMADRAHCLSSDSVITLSKQHQGRAGRLHVVVNFGSGIHVGVCLLREEKGTDAAS